LRKSLFRLNEFFELSAIYFFCFAVNITIDITGSKVWESAVIDMLIKDIVDYRLMALIIVIALPVMFHYKMVNQKKTEVFCRILTGDTTNSIIFRYILECLFLLSICFLISIFICLINSYIIKTYLFLYCLLVILIFVSAVGLKKL
jgi:hypothetical protein